ncbi:MAG: hypothetical protein GX267_04545 [Fibrobacter sp.]|jgi:hypothetical protein|nr:hypothetical protein [Fibrobacter sp.]
MDIQPFLCLFTLMGTLFSTFSFFICLYVATTLGKRLRREVVLSEITRTYCEIREFNFKCRIFLQKFKTTPYYKLLGSFHSDLQRICINTDQIFLEAFISSDYQKLLHTQKALKTICSQIHSIMVEIEFRLKTVCR